MKLCEQTNCLPNVKVVLRTCTRDIITNLKKMQPFAKFLPPADKVVEIFSFCSQGSQCNHRQWCYWSVTGHMGTPQPCLPPSPYRDTSGPNSSPSPCRDALDVFKLVPHGPQHRAHPRHVQTCSTWTSSYRDTTHPLDMLRLDHYVAWTVGKPVVGIWLKCLLVFL